MHLVIDRVGKRYGRDGWALREVTLDLGPGVHGLLGPNGAGKSTLMRILATVTRPTEGGVRWGETDALRRPDELRRVLGYLPQDFGVYPNLDPVEFLSYLAAAKGLGRRAARARIDGLLELVNLTGVARRPIGTFSGGMRQRVGIAQALLNDPAVLIVDEPTVGLDPEERVRFRNLIADVGSERVVLLSTHIVSDVEATASRVALIARGRLLCHALPEELIRSVQGRVWGALVASDALAELRERHRVGATVRRSDGVYARVVADEPPTAGAEPLAPTLEDAYVRAVAEAAAPGVAAA